MSLRDFIQSFSAAKLKTLAERMRQSGTALFRLHIHARGRQCQPLKHQMMSGSCMSTTAPPLVPTLLILRNRSRLRPPQMGCALVGATPWKQQVALIIGVIFGSLVIGPVLDVLNTSFGFQGMPGAGPNALAAPQAALISSQRRARRQHQVGSDWLRRADRRRCNTY